MLEINVKIERKYAMTAKEYLGQLQRLDIIIEQKIKELDALYLKLKSVGGINYSKEKIQTSHSNDAPFVKLIEHIMELEEEINKEIDTFVEEKHKIINQIQSLKNRKHIEILYKHYVEFKSFDIISIEMELTYQYSLQLHGYALQDFKRTYPII